MRGKGAAGMRRRAGIYLALGILLLASLAAWFFSRSPAGQPSETPETGSGVRMVLDGTAVSGQKLRITGDGDLRVIVTLDGAEIADLPFEQAHVLDVIQDAGTNTVEITGEAVRMRSADCENQDCVHMGAVTRENLEARVMGGFIICLPHRVSVEVREK